MTYILGVDGGNTKTIALVARTDGSIVGVGRGGCGDIYGAAGPAGATAEIERAVLAALAAAGVPASGLAAGEERVDEPGDRARRYVRRK